MVRMLLKAYADSSFHSEDPRGIERGQNVADQASPGGSPSHKKDLSDLRAKSQ